MGVETNTDVAILDEPNSEPSELSELDIETEELPFNDAFYKICKIIESFGDNSFTIKQIWLEVGREGFCRSNIGRLIKKRIKSGAIEKIKYGLYRVIPGREITTQKLPRGFLVNAVWQILCEADQPLAFTEIVALIEEQWPLKSGQKINVYGSVAPILLKWYEQDAISRHGTRRNYTYQKKQEITDRPLILPH